MMSVQSQSWDGTEETELTPEQKRRRAGALIGFFAGLTYSLVAALVNPIALWGVPLRVDPLGIGLAALATAIGGLIAGMITAWPENGIKGVVVGALAVTAYQSIAGLLKQGGGAGDLFLGVVVIVTLLLPALMLAVPIAAPLRWAASRHHQIVAAGEPRRWLRLAQVWAIMLLAVVLVASLNRMPSEEEAALRQVNSIVAKGLNAETPLPASLKDIRDFRARAAGAYSLDYTTDVSADFSISGSTAMRTIIVAVLFENGLQFNCQTGATLARPLCSER